MSKESNNYWIGAECFCIKGGELRQKSNTDLIHFAALELERTRLVFAKEIPGGTVVRIPKTHLFYVGEYVNFNVIQTLRG